MGALGVVLPLLPARGGWRNGRRARFRSVCPKGREGSNPSSPTRRFMLFAGRWPASRVVRGAGPGGRPPGTPRAAHSPALGSRRWPRAGRRVALAVGPDDPPLAHSSLWVLAVGLAPLSVRWPLAVPGGPRCWSGGTTPRDPRAALSGSGFSPLASPLVGRAAACPLPFSPVHSRRPAVPCSPGSPVVCSPLA